MEAGRRRTALAGIVGAVFFSGTAIGSILPILPLFLRERGASYGLVGVIVGAALVAQAVGQWPAGWLADRVGRRMLMVGGLLVAAGASVAFVLPLSVAWLVVLRFVQGLGFAAAGPAERAAVADVVPTAELGVAYGWLSAARQSGLIVGPALGGLLAVFGRWTVFVTTGVALAVAALVAAAALGRSPMTGVKGLPAPVAEERRVEGPAAVRRRWSGRGRMAVQGVLLLMVGIGLLSGIYDVIWSLYMRAIGASDLVIGLSFSLWALPLVVITPLAGWASDRWDRRWLAVSAVVLTALVGPVYPFLRNIPVVLAVGALEAGFWAFAEPPVNAFLMEAVPEARGEAQGLVGTVLSGAMAIGALVAGALFAAGLAVPFVAGCVVCVGFGLAAVPSLRAAGRRAEAAAITVA